MQATKSDPLTKIGVKTSQMGRVEMKFTQTRIGDISLPSEGQQIVWDTEVRGLGIRSTPTAQVFIVYIRVDGTPTRLKLGRVGSISLARARALATTQLGAVADNRDPRQEKQKATQARANEKAREAASALTLQQAFEAYIEARRHKLKPATIKDYRRVMDTAFDGWKSRRLIDITPSMIVRKYNELITQAERQAAKHNKTASGARAGVAMRTLRAVCNFASHQLADDGVVFTNPVNRLSEQKRWAPPKRKDSHLTETTLPLWWRELHRDSTAQKMKDYFTVLLLTGLRRGECARMQWRDVDLKQRLFVIRDTKNRKDHTLPITDHVFEILHRRHLSKGNHTFVFPGQHGVAHLTSPWKVLEKIEAGIGVHCSCHDLRRSFGVVAAATTPYSTVKQLLNHSDRGDVSLGYLRVGFDQLRKDLQRIESKLLGMAEQTSGNVVRIRG